MCPCYLKEKFSVGSSSIGVELIREKSFIQTAGPGCMQCLILSVNSVLPKVFLVTPPGPALYPLLPQHPPLYPSLLMCLGQFVGVVTSYLCVW